MRVVPTQARKVRTADSVVAMPAPTSRWISSVTRASAKGAIHCERPAQPGGYGPGSPAYAKEAFSCRHPRRDGDDVGYVELTSFPLNSFTLPGIQEAVARGDPQAALRIATRLPKE